MYNVVLIGCGHMGSVHLDDIYMMKDICVYGVVDTGGIAAKIDDETPSNSHNYGMMTMRLSDGSTAYYEAGWGNTIAAENVKEFIGPLGRIRITERENRADCH